MLDSTREVGKFLAGKESKVEDRGGGYASLHGREVKKIANNEALVDGNYVKVIDNMIFQNGNYAGSAER